MIGEEKALRGLFTRIAVILLFLVLFFNIYSAVYVAREGLISLVSRFGDAIWLDCITDIFCSLLYFLSLFLPALIFYVLTPKSERISIDFSMRLSSPGTLFKTATILFLSIGTIVCFSNLNIWLVPSFSAGASITQNQEPYQLILLMFSGAVIPAFAEELLFRGVLITHLKPYGKGTAVLVSAFLFGVMHMNLSQLLYATAAGVVLGVVYVSTNSFWLCFLIHFANNLFNLAESYMFQIFRSEEANLICMLAEITIFALGILFALGYVLSAKKKKATPRPLGVFGKTQAVEVGRSVDGVGTLEAFFCPAMIIYLAFAVLNMLYAFGVRYFGL